MTTAAGLAALTVGSVMNEICAFSSWVCGNLFIDWDYSSGSLLWLMVFLADLKGLCTVSATALPDFWVVE